MRSFKISSLVRPAAVFLFATLWSSVPLQSQKADRSAPPAIGPPPVLALPAVHRTALSNGLPVVVMEKRGVPLVEVHVVFNRGSVNDPAKLPGLAVVTAAMMNEGAGTRDALALADAIDFLGARLSVTAALHSTAARLFTPLSKLDDALALLADVVLRPTFPAKELDRQRKDRLTQLMQMRDEPRQIASVLFNRELYGEKHPYGVLSSGSEGSLRAMTEKDLRLFYNENLHAGSATIIVAGDIDRTTVLAKLDRMFGQWKSGPDAKRDISTGQVGKRRVLLVDKPGAAQSEIRIGRVGAERTTPDYFPLLVLNTVLGGSFTSRLNQNLREQHGYTYGAGSSFAFRPAPGPFTASSAVQTAVTDKALQEFMKELRGIMQPVPKDELDRAKNYVALGYPQNFQSVSDIAGELEELVQYNLPETYFNTFIPGVLSVTEEDITRAAKTWLDPDRMLIVVVGDRSKIEDGIRALKLGDIDILDVEDVLGSAPDLSK